MIQTNAKDNKLIITLPGSEGEYIAIMQSLVLGMMHLPNESSPQYEDAKRWLGDLLLAMLPTEDNIALKNKNSTN